MKKPLDLKRLRVCDTVYKIVVVDGEKIEVQENGDHRVGRCSEAEGVIQVASHSQQPEQTLLHEIVHAIDYNRYTNLTEEQVGSLSHGLYQVLRDSKIYFGGDE